MLEKKVAFMGNRGSGKSTQARMLGSKGFDLMSFADPVYGIAARIFHRQFCGQSGSSVTFDNNFSEEEIRSMMRSGKLPKEGAFVFNGVNFPEGYFRNLLESVGQGSRDWIGSDVFVKNLIERSENRFSVAVDDMRYRNEHWLMREAGFKTIFIDMPESDNLSQSSENCQMLYEEGLIDPDLVIKRSDGIEENFKKTCKFLEVE